jgi:PhzF family phenazine biosynthesis protein
VSAGDGRLVQECGGGNLPLRVEGSGPLRRIYVEAPVAQPAGDFPDRIGDLSKALACRLPDTLPPAAFNNGPDWLFVQFGDGAAVKSLKPDLQAMTALSRELSIGGIAAFALVNEGELAVHIRCFAPAAGIPEDPVTGSANAALPAYLARYGLLEQTGREYVASQGTELGRDGRVHVRVLDDSGRAEIGGQAVTVVDGWITIDPTA